MKKYFLIQIFLILISSNIYANILIPTFVAHAIDRVLYGEQIYRASDVSGILWQLGYWSRDFLVRTALSQALNDVVSDKGKYSGTVSRGGQAYDLYHASAGRDDRTATLFFVINARVASIVGIAKHIVVKACQAPKYEIVAWDDRYTHPR